MFIVDYKVAYNHAVTEARRLGREMQLLKGKEYNSNGFHVNFAVAPQHRFGRDAQGEFIKASDPLVCTHIAQAGHGYDHGGQNFSRLTEDTPVVAVEAEYAKPGSVIVYRASDGLRMHIQKKALKPVEART